MRAVLVVLSLALVMASPTCAGKGGSHPGSKGHAPNTCDSMAPIWTKVAPRTDVGQSTG